MLVALATNPKDIDCAFDLVDWMRDLQPNYNKHWLLLIGAATLDSQILTQLTQHARTCGFKQVVTIKAVEEDPISWPNAANAMWRLAAQYVSDQARCYWLWLEPDAIPMQPGWLDKLESEYLAANKPFFGTIYEHPFKHLNGIAIYPSNIRRYNPIMFNSDFFGAPFDTVRPDLTLRFAHVSKSIVRSLADPQENRAHTFPDEASLSIIPPECLVFHGNKDRTLIRRLRGTADPTSPYVPKVEEPSMLEKIVDTAKRWISGETAFFHSGNLGDVAYGLSAIKAVGGGDLIIGPEQRKTQICAVPIDRKQFEMFLPLLKAQPYLKNITYSATYPSGAHDLNHFRNLWVNQIIKKKNNVTTLRECHFLELGVLSKINDEPWLECPNPIKTDKVIVHRSPRYQAPSTGPQSFPWRSLVQKHGHEMMFVGLETEHETFCKTFEIKISFWKVRDFLELAQVIAGGRAGIFNQSFPLSVALGLGKKVLCESCPRSPDCRIGRDSYWDQLQERPMPEL